MKKQLIAMAGLAVLAAPAAYASKARVVALGSGLNGGFHYNDQRSTFTNPAKFNLFNNYAIVEWGGDNTSGSANASLTTQTNANAAALAEGGFVRSAGNFIYGVYLGNDSQLLTTETEFLGVTDSGTNTFMQENNRIELSIAGDAGVQWGATLWRSDSENQVSQTLTQESDSMGLRAGILMGNIDAALELDFGGEHKGSLTESGDKLERDFGFAVDLNYAHNDWTFNLAYASGETEQTEDGVTTGTDKREKTAWSIGAGQNKKLNNMATLLWDIQYAKSEVEFTDGGVDGTASDDNSTTDAWSIPLTIAMEVEANSWLSVRGSVSQSILDSTETKLQSTSTEDKGINATSIGAGASLKFGKLMIDGTISTASAGNYNLGANTLSRVAMHYWF